MAKYALIIGVNQYKEDHAIQPLEFAVKDAVRVNNFLASSEYECEILPGSEANWSTVMSSLQMISQKLKDDDTFLFYFSGHGFQTKDEQYILPYDAQTWAISKESGNAVSLGFIEFATRKDNVRRVIVVDACRKPLERGKSLGGSDEGFNAKAIEGVVAPHPEKPAVSILYSCSSGEQSYEIKSLKAGVFTEAFCTVLEQYRTQGREVSLSEIHAPIKKKMDALVAEHLRGQMVQSPFLNGEHVMILDGRPASEALDRPLEVKESGTPLDFGSKPGVEKGIAIAPSVSMTFCWCPSTDSEDWIKNNGDHDFFMMGMPASRALKVKASEQQKTRIKQGFWISKFPVTQAQYLAVTGVNPSFFQEGDGRGCCPVESVSFYECTDFMNRLVPPVNWEFRLPSNVEWEYAARAGTKGLLPAELQRDSLYGLVVALSRSAWVEMPESIGTVPVGSKPPNKWGLCDILGNVWEWCEGSGNSVLRGGSWSTRSTECHLSSEMNCKADFKNNTTGFRLVLAPSGQNL